jgi:dTDP-4-dehydrorhamnose 3,5-epimerase
VRGRILDRRGRPALGSPTYGRHVAVELRRRRTGGQLFVPGRASAHGFVTLEPDTEVAYKISAPLRRRP